jgi:hypothetical protein
MMAVRRRFTLARTAAAMPRKSAAELSVVPIDARSRRLGPPASLGEAERKLFADLVATNKPNHFQRSDLPLLCRYVEATVMAERAAAELRDNPVINGRASPWLVIQEKNVRAMISLSMRLRLSPQARAPNNPTRPRSQTSGSVYDRIRLENNDDGQA